MARDPPDRRSDDRGREPRPWRESGRHHDFDACLVSQLAVGATVIAIDGLGKRYGSFDAVRDLTVSVDVGEVFGFLGPNGAGKTTTIRMLMGILAPSTGRASI